MAVTAVPSGDDGFSFTAFRIMAGRRYYYEEPRAEKTAKILRETLECPSHYAAALALHITAYVSRAGST